MELDYREFFATFYGGIRLRVFLVSIFLAEGLFVSVFLAILYGWYIRLIH